MAAHRAFESNLRVRVCREAGVVDALLDDRTSAWLAGVVHAWVETRHLDDAEVSKAAERLKRRAPKESFSKTTTAAATTPSVDRRPQQQQQQPAPVSIKEPRPWAASSMAAAAAVHDDSTRRGTMTTPEAGALSASAQRSVSPPSQSRLLALQRRQRALADKEWNEFNKVAEEEEERRQQALAAERARVREQMRQDMITAEKFQQLKQQAERDERQRLRDMVIETMEDVKADEASKKERQRSKFVREKEIISEQREARRLLKEERVRREAEDGAAYRARLSAAIHEEHQLRQQYQGQLRSSLLEFLDESRDALEAKQRQQRDERQLEKTKDLSNLSFLTERGATTDVGGRKVEEKRQKIQQLQSAVAVKYSSISEHQQREKEEEARRIQAAIQREEEKRHQRAAEEEKRKRETRAALVKALEVECAINHRRKEEALKTKEQDRTVVDQDVKVFKEVMTKEQREARARHLELHQQLAHQQQLNEELKAVPYRVKVGDAHDVIRSHSSLASPVRAGAGGWPSPSA